MLRRGQFTLAVAFLTALAVGPNFAISIIVDGVLLRSLGYDDPDSLIVLTGRNLTTGQSQFPVSPADFVDLQNSMTTVDSLEAYFPRPNTFVTARGNPTRVEGVETSTGSSPRSDR